VVVSPALEHVVGGGMGVVVGVHAHLPPARLPLPARVAVPVVVALNQSLGVTRRLGPVKRRD